MSIRGTPIDDNGFVDVRDIDGFRNDNGLLCLTNNTDCCGNSQGLNGDWYFPSGTRVGSFSDNGGASGNNHFFRNRGQSVVRLNQRGQTSERGKFSCELINGDGVNETIVVNIRE